MLTDLDITAKQAVGQLPNYARISLIGFAFVNVILMYFVFVGFSHACYKIVKRDAALDGVWGG